MRYRGRKPKRKHALVREHAALANEALVDNLQLNDIDAASTELAQGNESLVDTEKRKTTKNVTNTLISTGRILTSSTLINS